MVGNKLRHRPERKGERVSPRHVTQAAKEKQKLHLEALKSSLIWAWGLRGVLTGGAATTQPGQTGPTAALVT